MKAIAVLGAELARDRALEPVEPASPEAMPVEPASPEAMPVEIVSLDGRDVPVAVVDVPPPDFDPSGRDRDGVLVRTEAFSCNYRDAALAQRALANGRPDGFYVIGSELSGMVIACGEEVTDLEPGARVVVNSGYGPGEPQPWGMPTNHASRELHVLARQKVHEVPQAMSAIEAAAFSLGAQTSAAMVRRADVGRGDEVLVTSASSNTSLFIISALHDVGCVVSALTSSGPNLDALAERGASRVYDGSDQDDLDRLVADAKQRRGFEAVLDPFADVNLPRTLRLAGFGARIVTCGSRRRPAPSDVGNIEGALHALVRKQVSIIGSCLGTTADLAAGVERWTRGALPVPIDSVHAESAGNFFRRTFVEPDRFGKVVFDIGALAHD